jgi:hypothetical protein
MIEERCPHLFATLPVFVSREHVEEMAAVIRAVEEVLALPAYREAALAWAPEIARHDPGAVGAFIGYDFHIGAAGPRLIEINIQRRRRAAQCGPRARAARLLRGDRIAGERAGAGRRAGACVL